MPVIDERLLLCEPRGADVALERFLARVRPHVALHVAARLESHIALLARVGPLASMPARSSSEAQMLNGLYSYLGSGRD